MPASRTSVTARRMAHGATAPRQVIGMANIRSVPANDAMKAPAERSAKAPVAASNSGRVAKGRSATVRAATITTAASARMCGCRSARRPPTQYPTDRYSRVMPMTLAQTTFDVPKYGARSRAPVTSVASDATPARNTTRDKRRRGFSTDGNATPTDPDGDPACRFTSP